MMRDPPSTMTLLTPSAGPSDRSARTRSRRGRLAPGVASAHWSTVAPSDRKAAARVAIDAPGLAMAGAWSASPSVERGLLVVESLLMPPSRSAPRQLLRGGPSSNGRHNTTGLRHDGDVSSLQSSGSSSSESTTTGRGVRPSQSRTVRLGLSFFTVPTPTTMASWAARSSWVILIAAGQDSAIMRPSRSEIEPSTDWANERQMNGQGAVWLS
mmetsp:Transcript_19659/g.75491  ORF Transcript_19659/g.75491 Transcript_19659/m.75491 type:complete len:212 (-) Transcript_19659:170-805(-)